MKNKISISILAILSLIFGIIAFVLSFLPLGLIPLVPGAIGLIFSIVAFLLLRKFNEKKKIVSIALTISVLAILISIFSEVLMKDEVAEDNVFEEKIKESEGEDLEDLDEALEDLEFE